MGGVIRHVFSWSSITHTVVSHLSQLEIYTVTNACGGNNAARCPTAGTFAKNSAATLLAHTPGGISPNLPNLETEIRGLSTSDMTALSGWSVTISSYNNIRSVVTPELRLSYSSNVSGFFLMSANVQNDYIMANAATGDVTGAWSPTTLFTSAIQGSFYTPTQGLFRSNGYYAVPHYSSTKVGNTFTYRLEWSLSVTANPTGAYNTFVIWTSPTPNYTGKVIVASDSSTIPVFFTGRTVFYSSDTTGFVSWSSYLMPVPSFCAAASFEIIYNTVTLSTGHIGAVSMCDGTTPFFIRNISPGTFTSWIYERLGNWNVAFPATYAIGISPSDSPYIIVVNITNVYGALDDTIYFFTTTKPDSFL